MDADGLGQFFTVPNRDKASSDQGIDDAVDDKNRQDEKEKDQVILGCHAFKGNRSDGSGVRDANQAAHPLRQFIPTFDEQEENKANAQGKNGKVMFFCSQGDQADKKTDFAA